MKARSNRPTSRKSPAQLIDAMIKDTPDWRGATLARLRRSIKKACPSIVEKVKWRKPTNPDGVPVWSHEGIVCVGNILKAAVRLTFPQGAQIKDTQKTFNTRLDSRTVRAIDVHEGGSMDDAALKAIVLQAGRLNSS